ncbi:superinfection immunity protein [Streptomyces sp. NPDC005349]|uniref:superinfection immunity protein n=1 Tax=Streptomyces sp. NPDC005349 TaxID=3157037 RepID=UPI0033BC81A5
MLSNIGPLELLGLVAAAIVFFVPTIVAYRRKVERQGLIIVVNLLAGATGVAWFVALYMAMTMSTITADVTPSGRLGWHRPDLVSRDSVSVT